MQACPYASRYFNDPNEEKSYYYDWKDEGANVFGKGSIGDTIRLEPPFSNPDHRTQMTGRADKPGGPLMFESGGEAHTGVVTKCTFCVHRNERLKTDLLNGKAGYLSKKLATEVEAVKRGEKSIAEVAAGAVNIAQQLLRTIMRGEGDNEDTKNLEGFEARYIPACAANCPVDVFTFGDLDDPNSEVSKLLAHRHWMVLRPELGTKPMVYYLR
ncbi:MAG: hypothetical protein ACE5KO_01815 [Candidatus Bathyarchaeia archaeon]